MRFPSQSMIGFNCTPGRLVYSLFCLILMPRLCCSYLPCYSHDILGLKGRIRPSCVVLL